MRTAGRNWYVELYDVVEDQIYTQNLAQTSGSVRASLGTDVYDRVRESVYEQVSFLVREAHR
jgi:hypothetical protein